MRLTENELKYLIKEIVRRIVKEYNENPTPSVYVGTYGKYNSGSLEGEWVDLTRFDSKKEFLNYCYNTLHANERDAELMFQDYEYIPEIFIGESFIDERFWDFMKENNDYPFDVKYAVANHVSDVDEYFNVIDDIVFYPGCKDMSDVAYYSVKNFGYPQNMEEYFDFDAFGNALWSEGNWVESDEGMIEIA